MLVLKLIQSLFKAVHSEGTPGQLTAGLALGSILGLTPLWNLHNAVVFALIIVLNARQPGGRGRSLGAVVLREPDEVRGAPAAVLTIL